MKLLTLLCVFVLEILLLGCGRQQRLAVASSREDVNFTDPVVLPESTECLTRPQARLVMRNPSPSVKVATPVEWVVQIDSPDCRHYRLSSPLYGSREVDIEKEAILFSASYPVPAALVTERVTLTAFSKTTQKYGPAVDLESPSFSVVAPVAAPAPPPPPPVPVVLAPPVIVAFTASKNAVYVGQTVTLSWTALNSEACTLNPWALVTAPIGAHTTPALATTATFSLHCHNPSAMVSQTITVTVNPIDCNSSLAHVDASAIEIKTENWTPLATRYAAIRAQGYALPPYWNPYYGPGDGINLANDPASATAACNMMGYRNGVVVEGGKWSSPYNNAVLKWNPATRRFAVVNALLSNSYAFRVSCSVKLIQACTDQVGWFMN